MEENYSAVETAMKFQDPGVAIALHRLEMLATVAAVTAAATFVGSLTTLVALDQAATSGQAPVMPSEALLWQELGSAD